VTRKSRPSVTPRCGGALQLRAPRCIAPILANVEACLYPRELVVRHPAYAATCAQFSEAARRCAARDAPHARPRLQESSRSERGSRRTTGARFTGRPTVTSALLRRMSSASVSSSCAAATADVMRARSSRRSRCFRAKRRRSPAAARHRLRHRPHSHQLAGARAIRAALARARSVPGVQSARAQAADRARRGDARRRNAEPAVSDATVDV